MKKHEKEVELFLLDHEETTINKLRQTYDQALKDINAKLKELNDSIDRLIEDAPDNETLIRSKIYQRDYQKALKKQINAYLDVLKDSHVKTIDDYLKIMYEDSFLTNIYNLHCYKIPAIVPINQNIMKKALDYDVNNIPLSKRLYANIDKVKKDVLAEISRGISTGMTYDDIARNIRNRVDVSFRKAKQIAQNEGQRIKIDARIDSMKAAKEKGANIVKVWDSTLDNHTRPVHRELDQQHAELDEPFECSAGKVQAPKKFGRADLDINCRCILLSVPRWDIEDSVEKLDNITGKLIETSSYADWKKKYYNVAELKNVQKGSKIAQKSKNEARNKKKTVASQNEKVDKKTYTLDKAKDILRDNEVARACEANKVKYNDFTTLQSMLSDDEIIKRLGGGDKTKGSCVSLAYAYVGNKSGLDVLDFRSGNSLFVFSTHNTTNAISNLQGVKSISKTGFNDINNALNLLEQMELDKEYILYTGKHASIVKRTEKEYFYLELQSATSNGYKKLDTEALVKRFKCKKVWKLGSLKLEQTSTLIDTDRLAENEEFKYLLGYINTEPDKQKKGANGGVK